MGVPCPCLSTSLLSHRAFSRTSKNPSLPAQRCISYKTRHIPANIGIHRTLSIPPLPSTISFQPVPPSFSAFGQTRLQLIPNPSLQIRHTHNLNHQARPAREVLRALSLARLRIVLLPREASLFPALVHGAYEVFAERGVEFLGLGLVRAFLLGNFLDRG